MTSETRSIPVRKTSFPVQNIQSPCLQFSPPTSSSTIEYWFPEYTDEDRLLGNLYRRGLINKKFEFIGKNFPFHISLCEKGLQNLKARCDSNLVFTIHYRNWDYDIEIPYSEFACLIIDHHKSQGIPLKSFRIDGSDVPNILGEKLLKEILASQTDLPLDFFNACNLGHIADVADIDTHIDSPASNSIIAKEILKKHLDYILFKIIDKNESMLSLNAWELKQGLLYKKWEDIRKVEFECPKFSWVHGRTLERAELQDFWTNLWRIDDPIDFACYSIFEKPAEYVEKLIMANKRDKPLKFTHGKGGDKPRVICQDKEQRIHDISFLYNSEILDTITTFQQLSLELINWFNDKEIIVIGTTSAIIDKTLKLMRFVDLTKTDHTYWSFYFQYITMGYHAVQKEALPIFVDKLKEFYKDHDSAAEPIFDDLNFRLKKHKNETAESNLSILLNAFFTLTFLSRNEKNKLFEILEKKIGSFGINSINLFSKVILETLCKGEEYYEDIKTALETAACLYLYAPPEMQKNAKFQAEISHDCLEPCIYLYMEGQTLLLSSNLKQTLRKLLLSNHIPEMASILQASGIASFAKPAKPYPNSHLFVSGSLLGIDSATLYDLSHIFQNIFQCNSPIEKIELLLKTHNPEITSLIIPFWESLDEIMREQIGIPVINALMDCDLKTFLRLLQRIIKSKPFSAMDLEEFGKKICTSMNRAKAQETRLMLLSGLVTILKQQTITPDVFYRLLKNSTETNGIEVVADLIHLMKNENITLANDSSDNQYVLNVQAPHNDLNGLSKGILAETDPEKRETLIFLFAAAAAATIKTYPDRMDNVIRGASNLISGMHKRGFPTDVIIEITLKSWKNVAVIISGENVSHRKGVVECAEKLFELSSPFADAISDKLIRALQSQQIFDLNTTKIQNLINNSVTRVQTWALTHCQNHQAIGSQLNSILHIVQLHNHCLSESTRQVILSQLEEIALNYHTEEITNKLLDISLNLTFPAEEAATSQQILIRGTPLILDLLRGECDRAIKLQAIQKLNKKSSELCTAFKQNEFYKEICILFFLLLRQGQNGTTFKEFGKEIALGVYSMISVPKDTEVAREIIFFYSATKNGIASFIRHITVEEYRAIILFLIKHKHYEKALEFLEQGFDIYSTDEQKIISLILDAPLELFETTNLHSYARVMNRPGAYLLRSSNLFHPVTYSLIDKPNAYPESVELMLQLLLQDNCLENPDILQKNLYLWWNLFDYLQKHKESYSHIKIKAIEAYAKAKLPRSFLEEGLVRVLQSLCSEDKFTNGKLVLWNSALCLMADVVNDHDLAIILEAIEQIVDPGSILNKCMSVDFVNKLTQILPQLCSKLIEHSIRLENPLHFHPIIKKCLDILYTRKITNGLDIIAALLIAVADIDPIFLVTASHAMELLLKKTSLHHAQIFHMWLNMGARYCEDPAIEQIATHLLSIAYSEYKEKINNELFLKVLIRYRLPKILYLAGVLLHDTETRIVEASIEGKIIIELITKNIATGQRENLEIAAWCLDAYGKFMPSETKTGLIDSLIEKTGSRTVKMEGQYLPLIAADRTEDVDFVFHALTDRNEETLSWSTKNWKFFKGLELVDSGLNLKRMSNKLTNQGQIHQARMELGRFREEITTHLWLGPQSLFIDFNYEYQTYLLTSHTDFSQETLSKFHKISSFLPNISTKTLAIHVITQGNNEGTVLLLQKMLDFTHEEPSMRAVFAAFIKNKLLQLFNNHQSNLKDLLDLSHKFIFYIKPEDSQVFLFHSYMFCELILFLIDKNYWKSSEELRTLLYKLLEIQPTDTEAYHDVHLYRINYTIFINAIRYGFFSSAENEIPLIANRINERKPSRRDQFQDLILQAEAKVFHRDLQKALCEKGLHISIEEPILQKPYNLFK